MRILHAIINIFIDSYYLKYTFNVNFHNRYIKFVKLIFDIYQLLMQS